MDVEAEREKLEAELDQLKEKYSAMRYRAMVVKDILKPEQANQSASLTITKVSPEDRPNLRTDLELAGWTGKFQGVVQWTVTREKDTSK